MTPAELYWRTMMGEDPPYLPHSLMKPTLCRMWDASGDDARYWLELCFMQ